MQITNITKWMEETVRKHPDTIAVHDINGNLTYREYRRISLAVARSIIQKQIRRKPIAVYLEKSVSVLISFLGIAYSGNFYSPIDTEFPQARKEKMISVLQPQLVITRRNLKKSFDLLGYTGDYLFIEEIISADDDASVVIPLQDTVGGNDLLYVLFTSGSTGIPKGVSITHRSVINYIDWATSTFSFTSDDSFGNQAPFCFDNSIFDIYCSIKVGACLNIIPSHLFSQPVRLLQYLRDFAITTIFWVPSALIGPAKLKAFRKVDVSVSLKRVLFCGEVMPIKPLNVWRTYLPQVMYANLYGPTEITDACTCYIVSREFADTDVLPIGKPITNVRILLVTDEGKLASPGERGEICVLGVCLSPGYYRNQEKTAEVFVPSILNPMEIMYKTGDIARYNEDGDLLYLSRKDFQIKYLGQRIELGEIETAASSLDTVSRSCALYDDLHKKIILMIEPEPETVPEIAEIETGLALELPRYMMPNKIIIIDKMPINSNGKIDRLKLKESMK